MAVELGALIGAPAGGQSFENLSSWSNTGQTSLFLQSTDVHSSVNGARLEVYSAGAPGKLTYGYGQVDDLFAKWAPDVTTHALKVEGWARMGSAATSGMVTAVYTGGTSVPIPFAATLQYFRIDAPAVISGQALALDFQVMSGMVGSGGLFLDDILVSIDNMALAVDYSYQQARQIGRISHMTVGGREAMYNWFTRPRFQLPMTFMPGSQADILNRWWANGFNLCFCLNTSDSEARWTGRAGGGSPPAQGFRAPYFNVQPAAIQLEGLSGDLVF